MGDPFRIPALNPVELDLYVSQRLCKQILSLTTLFNEWYNVSVLKEISEIAFFDRLRLRKMRLEQEFGSQEKNLFQ